MVKRKYLLIKDVEDLRDIHYRATVPKSKLLPVRVDLRSTMSPIYDQLDLGSCSANAGVAFREYFLLEDHFKTKLSRLFLYYQERKLEGTISTDSGATLRDCMAVLKNTGVCPERDWPYDIDKFDHTPPAKAVNNAKKYRISAYHRVANIKFLKDSLANGYPVIYGIKVYDSFEGETVARTGIVPLPNKRTESFLGGHALLAVGYDEKKKYVITRNSWGKDWGDKGYCYMPYSAFARNGIVLDMWTGVE